MAVGWVAVAAAFRGQPVVWGAEVGGGDDDGGSGDAPLEILHAPDLVAGAADLAALEQRLAQPRRRLAVPAAHQIAIPAGSPDRILGVLDRVVGGPGRSPLAQGRWGGAVTGSTGRFDKEEEEEEDGEKNEKMGM